MILTKEALQHLQNVDCLAREEETFWRAKWSVIGTTNNVVRTRRVSKETTTCRKLRSQLKNGITPRRSSTWDIFAMHYLPLALTKVSQQSKAGTEGSKRKNAKREGNEGGARRCWCTSMEPMGK